MENRGTTLENVFFSNKSNMIINSKRIKDNEQHNELIKSNASIINKPYPKTAEKNFSFLDFPFVSIDIGVSRLERFVELKKLQDKNKEYNQKCRKFRIKKQQLDIIKEIKEILKYDKVHSRESFTNENKTYSNKAKSSLLIENLLKDGYLPFNINSFSDQSFEVEHYGLSKDKDIYENFFPTELKTKGINHKNEDSTKEKHEKYEKLNDDKPIKYNLNNGAFKGKIIKIQPRQHLKQICYDKLIDSSILPQKSNIYNKVSLKEFISLTKIMQKPFK